MEILQALLSGDEDCLKTLRQQAEAASVKSRQMTGVGFYTEFQIPATAPRVAGLPTCKIGDVNGTAENVKHGLGFLLYVKDGVLSMLEGYTYDDPWPDEVRGLALTYTNDGHRNLGNLAENRVI